MNKNPKHPVPIIDLFAGPGGLGEGFTSVTDPDGKSAFRIGLSIEKDPFAHKTLTLRSVFRQLKGTRAIEHYFAYVRGVMDENTFRSIPEVADAYSEAALEARCIELGKDDPDLIDNEITAALRGEENWLLIGGPPCQAYSLAGRSRRTNDKTFEDDVKHFLYREYLRIIRVHKPAVFVMENVKGLLTSRHAGDPMFQRILDDLSIPIKGLEYEIRSFTKHPNAAGLKGEDYVIQAEKYGIPQARHRVILLGVRRGLNLPRNRLLQEIESPFTVRQAIGDLPKLRSRLSTKGEQIEDWRAAISRAPDRIHGWVHKNQEAVIHQMRRAASSATTGLKTSGERFVQSAVGGPVASEPVKRWFTQNSPGGVLQHESRSHMELDLARYLFAASSAKITGISPRLDEFPPNLLPEHKNASAMIAGKSVPFMDRFRVQRAGQPATTVVSHIAKDGHYYIHYDPAQCRSLTVREAARLQTFPDNYFFEGNRTQQYTQVGNAVPPLLASKLAKIVAELF